MEEGYVSEEDEPLDIDGAGADNLFDGEMEREGVEGEGVEGGGVEGEGVEGEVTEGETAEVMDDGDDQPAQKRRRINADSKIALYGVEIGVLSFGRISRSISRSSSVSSVKSAMSLS